MSKFFYREMRSLALGPKLGEGCARKVYECLLNPGYVIKIEDKGKSFQNVIEWDVWSFLREGPLAKWLAPCHMISSSGSMLVMERVEPIRAAERPPLLPEFLCDLKRENFGMLKGRIVCCDYGTLVWNLRKAPRRMVRAEWRC